MFDFPQIAAIGLGAFLVGAVQTHAYTDYAKEGVGPMDNATFVMVEGRSAADPLTGSTSLAGFAQSDEADENLGGNAIRLVVQTKNEMVSVGKKVVRALID